MNIPVSFIDIKAFLIDSFREYSIYDFYSQKHPYLSNNNYLKPEINESNVLNIFNKKYNVDCKSLKDLKNWIYKNYEYIKDYNKYIEDTELNFKSEIEKLNIKLKQTEQNIENQKTEQLKIENQITEIQNEIENFPAVEEKNNLRIAEINEEINALTALKEKEPYKTQIENLTKEQIKIPSEFEKYKINLTENLESLNTKKQEIIELILQLNDEIVNIKKETELKEVEKTNEINKFKEKEFNQKDEEKALDFFKYLFEINSKDFDYIEYSTSYNLFTWLFEIYKPQNVELIELKKVLIEMLNEEIPNPYLFETKYLLNKISDKKTFHDANKIKLGIIYNKAIKKTYVEEEAIDLVFSIWNSLKNALNTEDIIKNINNIYYLSLSKFIYAKIMIYKNNLNNQKLFVALNSSDGHDYFCQNLTVLSGHTNKILQGILISYKDYVFIIDFKAKVL